MPIADIAPNSLAKPQVQKLYIGKTFTGVTIEPDARWPNMWRVRKGERLSDMVNLSRAKDAALTWARPKDATGGIIGTQVVYWR
jgi:hypothetical protein